MCAVAQLPALESFVAPTINLLDDWLSTSYLLNHDFFNGPLESEFHWAQMSICCAPVQLIASPQLCLVPVSCSNNH